MADGSIIIETRLDTDGIASGLAEIKDVIEAGMGDAESGVNKVLEAITEAIGKTDVASGAKGLVSAIVQTLSAGAGEIYSAASSSAKQAGEGIASGTGTFSSGGASLASAAAGGLLSAAGELVSAAGNAAARGAEAAGSYSGQYSSVGLNLMNALRSGIAAGASALYAKAAAVASSVLNTVKNAFGIHSPSKVFRDEIGKMLMLGLKEGISENTDAVLEACGELAEDMLESERKYLEEKERIEAEQAAADEASRLREYEKKLANAKNELEKEEIINEERLRLKKKADSEYLDELKENSERQREVIDALKDDITAVYKDIADHIENSLEPITESRDKLESRLKSFASENGGYVKSVINTPETTVSSIGARKTENRRTELYTLADQQESIDALRRYSSALELVRNRLENFSSDTAKDFMNAIAEMDVREGTVFAQTLASADDADFGQYIEKWETKNELAKAVARQFYSEDFAEAVDDCTQYMKTELEALGMEIPEGFFASGSVSAAEFGKGFTEGLDAILENARIMIESFGNYASELIGEPAQPVVNTNNYYSTYSVNGTKSTTAESIYAIEAAATMNRYRGID